MLLEFRFSNFRSFFEEQFISFEATALKGRMECIFPVKDPSIKNALPISLIMGSNASGKSNLLQALEYMRSQVLTSYSNASRQTDEYHTHRQAFALNKEAKYTPSRFETSFVQNNVPYRYGFSCDENQILEEWLYAYPNGQQQKWFQRNKQSYDFGKKMLGEKKALSDLTPQDTLFLSVGIRSEHPQLSELAKFFINMQFDYSKEANETEISNRLKNGTIDNRVIEFLRLLDTGIYDYLIQPKEFTERDEAFGKAVIQFMKAMELKSPESENSNDPSKVENAKSKYRNKVINEVVHGK